MRRITGGRAVLHDGDLTYSVSLSLQGVWRSLSVSQAFARIAGALMRGLLRLGVEARLGDPMLASGSRAESGACLLARGMPAILVGGRKLIGSAQRRWSQSLLQHGSLLLDFDPALHRAVFPGWPQRDRSGEVTCLRWLLGRVSSDEEIAAALVAGWGEAFGGQCLQGDLGVAELRAAEELARARYGNPGWTFRRADPAVLRPPEARGEEGQRMAGGSATRQDRNASRQTRA